MVLPSLAHNLGTLIFQLLQTELSEVLKSNLLVMTLYHTDNKPSGGGQGVLARGRCGPLKWLAMWL